MARKPPAKGSNIQPLISLIIGLALLGWGASGAGELPGRGASAAGRNQPPGVEALLGKDSPLGTNSNWIFVYSKRAEISVALQAIPLATVLAEIARKTGIEIRFVGASAQSTVSAYYQGLPLEKGLARLLRTHDYAFSYTNSGDTRRLTKVFVLPTQGEALAETESAKRAKPNPSATAADRAILLEAIRSARGTQSIAEIPDNTPLAPTATPEAGASPTPDNADPDVSRFLEALREQTSHQPAREEAQPLTELLFEFGPRKEP